MITLLEFEIPGKPEPQLRPRAVRTRKGVRMYDPKTTVNYKNYVAMIARRYAPKTPFEQALAMYLDIYRQIPKSTSKKRRRKKNKRAIRPIVRPDADNYSKAILDALNDIVYKDDSQVVDLYISKYYSDDPRVEVKICEVM